MTIKLLRAAPYEINGRSMPGKIHAIREGERAFCGNDHKYTGGEMLEGERGDVTCKICLRSMDSRERREEENERCRAEYAKYRAEREKQSQEWWEWYSAYLKTPAWAKRRRLVLQRAQGVCEGCRLASAEHVHHTTYQHVGDEMLYELVALCAACHQKVHPEKEIGAPSDMVPWPG